MMARDLAPAFLIDPDARAYVRDYIAGEFPTEMLGHWCPRTVEVTTSLPHGWRARLAVKVVTDLRGREQRLPVVVVENENLP